MTQYFSGNAKIGTVLRVPAKRQPPQEVGDGVTVGRKGKEDSFSMESQDFPSLGQSGHGGFSSDGFQNFAGWNKSSAFGPGRSGSLGDGDFPVLGCGSSHQVQQPSRPSSSPKGTKKIAGVVLIDDYEAFPSVSKSAKSKQQSLVEQVVSEKENITPVDNAWTKQGQRKSPSLFETLTSGAWSSRPKTLGQAAMALSNDDAEFPSLGGQGKLKGHKEVKPVALARAQAASVWHKPASCDSNSLITDDKKIIDSAVNKKKIEGFGKDCKNSDDTTVGKQRGVERLVTLPSAKTKARKVAQQKQRPSLSESLSTNELEDPQKDPELCEMFSLKNHEEKLPPGLEPPPGLQPAEEVSPSGMHAVPEKSQIVEHLHEHFHGKYEKPRNFDERNRKLFQKIALNLSSLQMDDFKMLSGMFRRGEAGAQFYFEQVESLLGAKVFEDIFPELLCLLPDIKRQRALLEVRETTLGTARNSAKSAKKRGPWQSANLFEDTIGEFRICRYCAQVLRDWDHAEHVSGHELDQDYPTLC